MKHRRLHFNNKKPNIVGFTLSGAMCAFVIMIIILALFAMLMTKIDVKENTLSLFSTAALLTGAFFGGCVSAKRRRKNGLLMGVITGVFIFITILILSAMFTDITRDLTPSKKLMLTLLSSGVGGIYGVNSKKY